jgi:hypothetical protein
MSRAKQPARKKVVSIGAPAEKPKIDIADYAMQPMDELYPPFPWTLEAAKDALSYINPEIERPEWMKVIGGLMTQFGKTEELKALALDQWSAGKLNGGHPPKNYKPVKNESDWNGFAPGHSTMGSVWWHAKQGGWDPAKCMAREPEDGPLLVTGRDSRSLAAKVWERLSKQESKNQTLFRSGRQIVRIGKDGISVLTNDGFWRLIASRLSFFEIRQKKPSDCDPPEKLIKFILNTPPEDLPLPELMGLTRTPVMTADGSVHAEAGYSEVSKLFHSPSVDVDPIPERPTTRQIETARELLEEIICDFPFKHSSDKAHALSLMILPFVRPMIKGSTPIYLIDKPVMGTGATKLGGIVTLIKNGVAVTAANAPNGKQE